MSEQFYLQFLKGKTMSKIKSGLLTTIAGILFCSPLTCLAQSYKPILERIGVNRGICVVLGDRRCELALEMARNSELLIYVQLRSASDLEKVCRIADEAGFYGTRIYVEKGPLTRIHLADNSADAAVVLFKIPKEVMEGDLDDLNYALNFAINDYRQIVPQDYCNQEAEDLWVIRNTNANG